MTSRILLAFLLTATIAFADTPATRPAKEDKEKSPSTRPIEPTRRPATRPADNAFPSAREMAARLMGKKAEIDNQLKVAFIDLDQPIKEKPAEFTLFGDTGHTLQSVTARLRMAGADKDVRAVLLNFGPTAFNMAQAQELRDTIADIRKAGKRVFVYADAYDTAAYIAASGSKDICIMPGGEIMIPGVGLETMFAKGLLDKVGVKADYVQIGQYKGADETYTRTEPSPEMRGELNKILDDLYAQIVDGIAYHRNISKADVKDMINNVMLSAKLAKERNFVDHVIDQDGLRDLVKKEMGRDVNLLAQYGLAPRQEIDFSNPFALFTSLMKEPDTRPSGKSHIAVIYAEGVIIDGNGGEGLLGGGGTVGSEDMRKAFRMAVRDPSVEAIVLRIDSPGGSAMASEVMWQAAKRAAKDKPLVISIGSMAASGGYYLASAGEYIFADPSAIVGSIGVVGGKFVFKDLFAKVGIHTEEFTRGSNAALFSSNQPFSDSQRRLVTNWMTQTYEQFTDRVMSSRGKKIKDIDEVAHGRIFLAKQARDLGMVDELGGLDKAVAHAAKKAGLDEGSYDVKLVPGSKTLADILRGHDPDAASPLRPKVNLNLGQLHFLDTMSPSTARLLRQQLQVLELLQKRPVMLVSPYVFTLK